jgi:transcriptional regulator with XRE-family HTH domain
VPKQIASQAMYEVSDNIRNRRKEIGMTQVELAFAAQLGENTIQRIESGQTQANIETLFRLAKALGVTLNDLAPKSFGFKSDNEQLTKIIERFEKLSDLDKHFFLKAAEIFIAGLHSKSP